MLQESKKNDTMKCPDTTCGFETNDKIKFCPECGRKLVCDDKSLVVICSGKTEDGVPCNTELNPAKKFCVNCGTKVDPQLFSIHEEKCNGCGTVLKGTEGFCGECGLKRKHGQSGKSTETQGSGFCQTMLEGNEGTEKEVVSVKNESSTANLDVEETVHQVSDEIPRDANSGNIKVIDIAKTSSNNEACQVTNDIGYPIKVIEKEGESSIETANTENSDPTADNKLPGSDGSNTQQQGNLIVIDEVNSESSSEVSSLLNTDGTLKIIEDSDSYSSNNNDISKGDAADIDDIHISEAATSKMEDSDSYSSNNNDVSKGVAENMDDVHISEAAISEMEDLDSNCSHNNDISKGDAANINDVRISEAATSKIEDSDSNSSNNKDLSKDDAVHIDDAHIPEKATSKRRGPVEEDQPQQFKTHFSSKNNITEKKTDKETEKYVVSMSQPQEHNGHEYTNQAAKRVVTNLKSVSNASLQENMEPNSTQQPASNLQPVFGTAKEWNKQPSINTNEGSQSASNLNLFTINNKEEQTPDTLNRNKHINIKNSAVISEGAGTGNEEVMHDKDETNVDDGSHISSKSEESSDTEESDSDSGRKGLHMFGNKTNTTSEQKECKKKKTNRKRKEKKHKKIEKQKEKNPKRAESSSIIKETDLGNRTNSKCYTVIFHVLLSPEFDFDAKEQHVVMKMGDESLGGSWKKDILFTCKRKFEDGVIEMTYEMKLPENKVRFGKELAYKYTIRKLKGAEFSYTWENYVKEKQSGTKANRTLFIPSTWKDQEIWHQYDGFMEKKPKGVFSIVADWMTWKKKLVAHVDLATQIFTQQLFQADVTDSIVQIEMLVHCLRKIYCFDARCWEYEDEYKKVVGTKIISAVLDNLFMKVAIKNETMEQKEFRIHSVVGVILAMKNMTLRCPDPDKQQMLCKMMCLQPEQGKMSCAELELVEKCFPGKRKSVLEAVIFLAQQIARTSKDPCWIYLMPWIHILSDSVQPFEKPGIDMLHDRVSAKWWGIDRIGKDCVEYFKGKSEDWKIPLEKLVDDIFPVFEVDYLLPRCIMAAVELTNLEKIIKTEKIPFEICLAATFYYIRKNKPIVWYNHYTGYTTMDPLYASRDEKMVCQCSLTLKDYMSTVECMEKTEQNKLIWSMRYKIALQMLKESSEANRDGLYSNCAQIVMYSIAIFESLMDENSQQKGEHFIDLKRSVNDVCTWIERWFWKWTMYMEDILKVWDSCLASTKSLSEGVRNMWNEALVNRLGVNLKNKVLYSSVLMTDFVQLYCRKVDIFTPLMQEVLGQAAFTAIAEGYNVNYANFNAYEQKRFGGLLSKLFIDEWKKAVRVNDKDDGEMILQHVMNWPPFIQFLKIYTVDQAKLKLLSEECTTALIFAVSVVESRVQALLSGSITIGNLNMIDDKDGKFTEIVEMLNLKEVPTKDFISNAVRIRKREMHAFNVQAELVITLTTLCSQLPVDLSDIDETLNKQQNLNRYQVRDFCKPADIQEVTESKDFQPRVCAFTLSEAVLGILSQLHVCYKSSTFIELWASECKAKETECKTLDDVVIKIWEPVKMSLNDIVTRIQDGSITFQKLEKHVGRKYKDQYDGIEKELECLQIRKNNIRKRLDQLKKYRQLSACVKGAKVILKFQKEFNLTGDFEQIRMIAEYDQNVMEMRSFDDNVMKTCEFLRDITETKSKSLDACVKCGQLVTWLRKSMKKSGLKELKVFVDLAFMSAGDEPINIRRVQCLHAAVTGYAPLIFDLKETAGYKELLDICRIVWKELEADQNLPQKLIDTNRNLEWLKDIKKAHGSVEVTSLVQAESINASGVYTVGKKASRDKIESRDEILVLRSSMKLTVSEVEGKRVVRNYTYENLQDLQSRLMLVAGKAEKGTDSVNRFTFIFDSIIRLASVNIKLCSAGCVLFKDWTARFLCDRMKPVCAVLEFGQGEESPTLKAKRNDNEDLEMIIPKIAKFMETCLENWLSYIKAKRAEYIHLNFFTIDQLVILQKELVRIGPEEQPSHLIYPLLSAIKQDCTQDDLMAAMTDTKLELDRDEEMKDQDEEESFDDGKVAGDENIDELRQTFIQEIVDAGYDEKLAIKALDHVDPEQVADGIVWCLNHEEDMEEDDSDESEEPAPSDRHEMRQKQNFEGWSTSTTSIQSLITSNVKGLGGTKGSSVDALLEDLKSLWEEFLGSISSNIKDYLSLEHLGMILKNLAARETSRVFRQFPPSFQEGSPNLIICPSGDVLSTTLSLYMLEKDQPLPQHDEVLMCTPHTTKDEVNIFWRRAIFGGGKKIHCLVNADCLDYDVSDAAERCLEQYIQETNHTETAPRYRLVVICGSDNEYRSRIVASLDKHRRPALPWKLVHLREYLGNKLQQRQPVSGVKPAAYVDFDKSTVRVVKSCRAGVGKTLYKARREHDLQIMNGNRVKVNTVSIPLQEKEINLHSVITRLLEHTLEPGTVGTRMFHIDVAHEVQEGVDYLLFNLLVLGCLTDKTGLVWRKSPTDLYLIETLPLMIVGNNRRMDDMQYVHQMLNVLPDMTCRSPQDCVCVYDGNPVQNGYDDNDQLFDDKEFQSSIFQRPYQYLCRLDQGRDLQDVSPQKPEGTPQLCLQTLLKHCGVEDPSWAELHHFVWFLDTQLQNFERSDFVSAVAAEDLPGFAQFVLRFLIQMSRDFSTRSLKMSEESPGLRVNTDRMEMTEGEEEDPQGRVLEQYQLRRTWESSPHPYLFFNSDHLSFTFLGFYIDRASGNLIDQQTGQVLERGIMKQNLYDSLVRNFVPIQENFDQLPRHEKILKMCNVMGVTMEHDPDDTYELTTDNVKKIMAIYMRFRCDIPVIIMGETGCGKTRLVKFMCGLQVPPGLEETVQNMILMKVHGGTTNADIIRKVEEAEKIAEKNVRDVGHHMYTVLFFDEANTTESIGLIKEIMCDKSMEGRKLTLCGNLKMVAACNPYREHSMELIKKLEQAGLGYHVDAEDTKDKFGRVPMRRLVYRVQPLPQSLLPLVWDFGQLNTQVEDLYIRQMVKRYIRDKRLPDVPNLIAVVSAILTASQDYMRAQKDECSFVSLRDVDRVLSVMSWFYGQSQENRTLYDRMDRKLNDDSDSDTDEEEEEDSEMDIQGTIDDVTRSLVLALGVCYHACLKTRDAYRQCIAPYFHAPCALSGGADQIEEEINCCQDVFLENVQLENNIARNMALKENVFMMVVCIELRVPLFLVGKPGSSKSLAKTIVSDAMQGNASREELFKELKQAQMVSFQCSPLSTPDGIVGTFKQCAQFQKDKDLDTFVSIVVLDEVGLAEDSPRMPLKTLHPLLEDGCQGDEKPEPYKKVAFIGISNWALDPAKMNRGILVQREVPDLEELENSARGICSTTKNKVLRRIEPLISPMCESYLEIFDSASRNMREFFGLRDFYSLVKMVYSFAEKSKQTPTWFEMLHAIKRNFGGLEQEKVDPVKFFKKKLSKITPIYDQRKEGDPDCSAAGLIEACLFERNRAQGESRYLLLLTENYGSLGILQQQILSRQKDIKPITIFGSSFRSDQEYTQVCRNINKIKVCMETGNTVVLLNLENLYESLYDALNQYYVYFGGERYVDLGLGTHRVKCPVHKKFRLIVVAEKQTVYDKFPIPLINRLEKHFLNINTMLTEKQQELAHKLAAWAGQFATQQNAIGVRPRQERISTNKLGDVFVGYHDDTCPAIILHVWTNNDHNINEKEILKKGKSLLLWVATPEAVVKLKQSTLPIEEQRQLQDLYFKEQEHDSIVAYLHQKLVVEKQQDLFVQVTTHSKLLATFHKGEISRQTNIALDRIMLLDTLSSFDTEQQFSNRIQQQLQISETDEPCLLIIQCDSGDINANLVACARYCVMDEYEKVREELRAPVHVVFIVQLPNIAGGCYTGFQCGKWHSVHIDDLWVEDLNLPAFEDMQKKSVAALMQEAVKGPVPMETNDEERTGYEAETMDWQDEESNAVTREDVEGIETESIISSADLHTKPVDSKGPLNIEDVIIGFEAAGQSRKIYETRSHTGKGLNVKDLILSCTQSALSMLKDKIENSQRTTERVALVLKLFHGTHLEGHDLFLQGMCALIANLLKEKEKNSYGAENWLTNEAARSENIRKAGTFRRSCVLTLESKISPILAGIIAHLDTNLNLDIMDANQLPWKHELWLAVLNEPTSLQLEYSDLQSPKRQSDLEEVVVITTGCEGHVFKAMMPFSWLIKQKMDEILKEPMPEQDDEDTPLSRIDFYAGVFEKTPLGKVLSEYNNSRYVQDMAEEYLHDFVCMSYKPLSDEEFQLVCQTIRYLYNQKANKMVDQTLTTMLLCIHESYRVLAPRLSYFHTMNIVWRECSAKIVKLKQEKPDHVMFQEQEFTFSTLCLLIEQLSPNKNELDQVDGRSKWLNKVHTVRPVVENVLRLHAEDPEIYGAHSFHSVQRARCLWNRVVVVKLFLEHVCAVESEDKITVKHCMPLWKLLDDHANLKQLKSLEAIEKFLKSCNKRAIKEFLGKQEKCGYCEMEIEGPPIVLPCEDLVCDQCYQDIVAMGDNSCLICQKKIPEGWTVERQTEKKLEKKKLLDYQKRCNSFFMDVVSQLCFYDNIPPSDDVIDKLLEYITCTTKGSERIKSRTVTKEMTIFNTGLDPNPVFRSFLLQLLMRTSEDKVMRNMDKYLKQAEILLRQSETTANEQYIDLSLLVIQCLEDILSQELNRSIEVDEAAKCLKRARQTIFTDELNVEKLYGLAEARIGLAVAAKAIAELIKQNGRATPNVRKLIEAAELLCVNDHTDFPRIYLVKYICRRFGVDVYQAVCHSELRYLMWIGMHGQQENKRVEISDRFVLCGDTYTRVRESLTKVVLGEDIQHLDETLQELRTAQSHVHVMLPMAIYREIACSFLYSQQQRKVTDKVVQLLQTYIQDAKEIKNKDLYLRFMQNNLGEQICPHLAVAEGTDFRIQGIQCLLTHYLVVLSHLQGDRTLLQPLIGLLLKPQEYTNTYIPTMPQDDLEDIKEALLAARKGGDENPVIYRCPAGHPYVIGNCGRPATVGKCKGCGQEIGGEGYQLRPGNIQHQGNDETQMGHILGNARNRGQGPRPERQMTPLYCACVRLMTHMSMYLGTINNIQAIQGMIIPNQHVEDIPQYLWDHIQADLNDLQRGLGRSVDDVFVLVHALVDNMMKQHKTGMQVKQEMCTLKSKHGRNDWENQFCMQFLQPVLKDCDQVLQQANKKIVQDKRLGADPLLCLLYETDIQQEQESPNNLEAIPAVWRYRSPVTLEHLRGEFEARKATMGKSSKHLKVLDLFLQEEHFLRAIRCIPSILKLQRQLFHKYQRKLDKAEASQITVGQIIRDKTAGEETNKLMDDFIIAWDICRDQLKQYLCPTELGGTQVPKDYCQPITDETPISLLLPAYKDEGLCVYALLDFLMRKQNNFLDKYIAETSKTKKRTTELISTVSAMEVTSAHLISYDPQQDLLPLILANCQYSFEIGKGTKIEYDFTSLERQIMDRFLFSKSKIDVGAVLKIELMVYRAEFTNGEVFKKLQEKIPQEDLSSAIKSQICSEMKTLPDLCQSLYNLDITISFLKSIGGDPADSLQQFMSETLQMKQTILSQKARQSCQFKHVQALWLHLALEKSKKMAEQKELIETVFESVNQQFQKDLPGDIEQEFRDFMKDISVDKLSELVSTLHELILLRMAVKENRDDEDYIDITNNKLRDWLSEYSDDQEKGVVRQILKSFPDTILNKHSLHAWITAYSMLYEKQTGDRKF